MASLSNTQRGRFPEQPNTPAFFLPPDIFSSNAYLVAWITKILSGVWAHTCKQLGVCILLKSCLFVRDLWKEVKIFSRVICKGEWCSRKTLGRKSWVTKVNKPWQDIAAIHRLGFTTWPKLCGNPLLITVFGYFSSNRCKNQAYSLLKQTFLFFCECNGVLKETVYWFWCGRPHLSLTEHLAMYWSGQLWARPH